MPNVSDFYFTFTAAIQRPTVTKGTSGGAKRVWATVSGLADLPASVQPANAGDIRLFGGRNLAVSHAVYVQSDPGIRRGDRMLLSDGRKFVIRGVLNYASFDRLYKLVCRELLT